MRRVASPEHLAAMIAEAVRRECAGLMGVIIERVEPLSREDANWRLKGVRFGTADRGEASRVLATVVERLQRDSISVGDDEGTGQELEHRIIMHVTAGCSADSSESSLDHGKQHREQPECEEADY